MSRRRKAASRLAAGRCSVLGTPPSPRAGSDCRAEASQRQAMAAAGRKRGFVFPIPLKVVQNVLNAGKRHHKDAYYAARTEQRRAVQAFVTCVEHGAVSPL